SEFLIVQPSEAVQPTSREPAVHHGGAPDRVSAAGIDEVKLQVHLNGPVRAGRKFNACGQREPRTPGACALIVERVEPAAGEHVSADRSAASLPAGHGDDLTYVDLPDGFRGGHLPKIGAVDLPLQAPVGRRSLD